MPNVRYADIAGQDQALAALRQIVQLPLTHADYFAALRVEPQAGILLYGPPGNGKTLLAKAVATESQAHLEIISGPEILSKWVGESEAQLRQIFARCRQWAPSVLLIDEIDCLAPRREGMSQQYNVQLIAQLLVLLDGLEARGRVAVVAATNRLEALDPAICRPGRFDYHIEVPLPDRSGAGGYSAGALAQDAAGQAGSHSSSGRRRRRVIREPTWQGCAERRPCKRSCGVWPLAYRQRI